MDSRLRIILELIITGFSSGVRVAGNIFKTFISGLTNGALSAARSLLNIAQAAFFLREAINTVVQAGRWLFDTFVRGAGESAKLEAKLKAIVGSSDDAARVMGLLRKTAADTGANFDELAAGAGLMAVAAKDASGNFDISKFQRLMNMLQRMAALRPDVPLDRLARGLSTAARSGDWHSLEMFLDVPLRQLVGIGDAAEEAMDVPGDISRGVTSLERGVSQAADDALASLDLLDEALTKAGATADIIGDVAQLSGLERFQQILKQLAGIVGEPLFDALNAQLSELADWLQANPDKVERLATLIGETLAGALIDVFEALEKVDWDKVAQDFDKIITAISRGDWEGVLNTFNAIGGAFKTIGDAVDKINQVGAFLGKEAVSEEQTARAIDVTGSLLEGTLLGDPTAFTRLAQTLLQPQKVTVEVDLKSDMLDARVRQGADQAVTEGLNQVAEEME